MHAADAALQLKREEIRRLSTSRRLYHVRAPFDGAIAARYVDPGATLAIGLSQPVLRVISSHRLFVRFAVPRDRAVGIVPRKPVALMPNGEPPRWGRVTAVAPEIDSASGMVYAEASFDEPASDVLVGLRLRVALR